MTHHHPRPRCRPPPLSLALSLAHTRVQILISPSNLHPFHNISPLFSSPAEQMLAARVSLLLDYTNRLPAFVSLFFFHSLCAASLLFPRALQSSTSYTSPHICSVISLLIAPSPWAASPSNPPFHYPNIPTLNVFPRVRQRARSRLIFYLPQNVS